MITMFSLIVTSVISLNSVNPNVAITPGLTENQCVNIAKSAAASIQRITQSNSMARDIEIVPVPGSNPYSVKIMSVTRMVAEVQCVRQ